MQRGDYTAKCIERFSHEIVFLLLFFVVDFHKQ